MSALTTSTQNNNTELVRAAWRWRSIPLGVRMMFVVAGALFAMAFTMMGVQAQTTVSNTVCLPVALPLSGAETRAVNSEPTLNFDGSRASFWSTANPVASNTDRSIEIFVADTSVLTGTNAPPINQVTVSRGNILGGFNVMPDMLTYVVGGVRHSLIVFASDRDYEAADSTLANSDGGFEIFLAQTEPTVKIWQLTDTSRSASIMPTISSIIPSFNGQDGRFVRIAYLSDADGAENTPKATNNADRNYEVHTMLVNLTPLEAATPGRPNLVAGQQFQLTRTTLDTVNDQPTVSANGTHVVFLSNASVGIQAVNTLSNTDRNREVFVSTVASTPTFIQVTKSSAGDNDAPDISDNGTRVAFASTVTNYPANAATPGTTAGAQSIYLARLDSASVTGFSRISSAVRAPNGTNAAAHPITAKEPAISNDGRRVVFSADGCDPSVTANACNQPAGLFQVFVVDQQTSSQTAFSMARVTNSITRTHELPSVSGNGQRIALVTTQESSVDNPDLSGSEIVALECRQALLGVAMTMETVSPSLLENRPDIGDTIAFRVKLENTTFADFAGTMTLTDTLPPGLSNVQATIISEPAGSQINIGELDGNQLVWEIENLTKLNEAVIEIRARVNALEGGLPKTNLVEISTDADLEAQGITNFIDTASVDFRVTQVDLSSSMAVSNSLPKESEVYTYTISVTNPLTVTPTGARSGSMDPATTVKVTTTLASLLNEMEFVGSSSSGATGSVAFSTANGVVTIDRVNPGTTALVRLGFRPIVGSGGKQPRVASITGIRSDQHDITAGNNISGGPSTIRVIGTDLATLSLTANQTIPPQGSAVVFAFTMRNRGPLANNPAPPADALATGANAIQYAPPWVRARALLPAGIVVTGMSDGGASAPSGGGTEVTWNFAGGPALEIAENYTLYITGTVTAGPGTDLTVQAGDLRAFFDPSGLQAMNDPMLTTPWSNNGLIATTVKVNSTATIGNLTPPDIDEGREITLTIAYTDTDLADTHVIEVDWGDGSLNHTSLSLSRPMSSTTGMYVVPHDYADDPPGINTENYTLSITVTDNTGNAVVSTPNLEVRNVEPQQTNFNITGHADVINNESGPPTYLALINQPITMTVGFTDTGYTTDFSSEDFAYYVTWGNSFNTDTSAAVLASGVVTGSVGTPTTGNFSIQHTFNSFNALDAEFVTNINVTDDDMALNSNTPRPVRFIVDQRPTAVDDYVYLLEGDSIPFNVITNDADNHKPLLELSNLSMVGISGTVNAFDATGMITYTANIAGLSSGEVQTDTLNYEISDEYGLTATAKVRIVVTGVNEAPIVDLNGDVAGIDIDRAFVEDSGELTLSPAGTLTDNDGQNEIQYLLVKIMNPLDGSFEVVTSGVFTTTNLVWDDVNHTLQISKASPSITPNWDAVLRSVKYANDSPDPDGTTREIRFVAYDGSEFSTNATANVTVQAVDDAPNIVLTTTVGAVNEGFSLALDASLRISDTDTPIWNGGVLTATVASASSLDALRVITGGVISVAGGLISYNGTPVASLAGDGTGQLVITFNTSAGNVEVETVARQIFYGRLSGPTSANPRTISLVAKSSAGGLQSNAPTRAINVTYTNDAPVITLTDLVMVEDTPTNVRANIQVSDSDSGTNNIRMRLQTSTGTFNVSGLGAALLGNGSGNVFITDTVTALDADGVITYSLPANVATDQVITVTVTDLGHSGGGGAKTTSAVLNVDVTPVNDAPTLDLNTGGGGENTSATYGENAAFTVLGVNNAAIGDVDSANMSALTVTLPVQNLGQEFLTVNVGATGIITSYNSSGILTMSGAVSRANYETVLKTLAYRNLSDDPGTSRTISVVVADDGALQSPVRTINLTITPVNDAPVLDLNGTGSGINYAAAFVEDFGSVSVVSSTATLLDPDSTQIMSATVRLTNRPDGGVEVLSATPQGGVNVGAFVSCGATCGVLHLTGVAPLSVYEAVIRSVRYDNSSEAPTTTPRLIDFKVADSAGLANVAPLPRTTLSVTPTNDPTQIDLNGNGTGFTHAVTYTENSPALSIVVTGGTGLQLVDPDGTLPSTFLTATIQIANQFDGVAEVLSVGTGPTINSNYNAGTGTLTLTGSANVSTYQNRLRQATYINNSDTPNTTPRSVVFRIWDSSGVVSPPITSTVSIVPFNDPPSVILATPTGVVEDVAIDLQQFITVTDPDAGAGDLTLTLTVTKGILNVSGAVTVPTNNDTTINATGTIAELMAAVYSFEPDADDNGSASLTARINDNGNTPTPAKSSGAGPAAFTIAADNDAPTLSSSSPTGVSEDVSTNIRTFFQVNDIDAGSSSVRMRVTVASGTLTGSGTGLTFGGNSTASVVMTGTIANLNAGPLNFLSAADMNGGNTITVTVNDLGNTGLGGQKTATTGPMAFTVDPVNDAPVVAFVAPALVQEDVSFDLGSAISVSDIDSGASLLRMRVKVASGTLGASGSGLVIEQLTPASVLITGTATSLDAASFNFLSNLNMSGSVNITTTVNDQGFTGSGGAKVTTVGPTPFTVTAVDDAPTITVNNGITVTAAATTTAGLTAAMLTATDVDSAGASIIYTVRTLPGAAGVVLRKSGSAMAVCGTFTQADLAGALIDFAVAGSVPRPTDTNFTFVVANAADCATATPVAFNIRVRAP